MSWGQFWDAVWNKKANRHDFSSHGHYVMSITFLGMLAGLFRVDTTIELAFVGITIGVFSTIIRELWDEGWGPGWEWPDILAGACGTAFAVLTMIALRGGI